MQRGKNAERQALPRVEPGEDATKPTRLANKNLVLVVKCVLFCLFLSVSHSDSYILEMLYQLKQSTKQDFHEEDCH